MTRSKVVPEWALFKYGRTLSCEIKNVLIDFNCILADDFESDCGPAGKKKKKKKKKDRKRRRKKKKK